MLEVATAAAQRHWRRRLDGAGADGEEERLMALKEQLMVLPVTAEERESYIHGCCFGEKKLQPRERELLVILHHQGWLLVSGYAIVFFLLALVVPSSSSFSC